MTQTLEESNAALRHAVETRLATGAYDEYITIPDQNTSVTTTATAPLAGCPPAQACAAEVLTRAWEKESCCEGQRLKGDSLTKASDVHPASRAYFGLLDTLRDLHVSKSSDYGSEDDPLANIRNGAEFVGIEPWRAAMVRLSDKVTRIATFNRTGSLRHESVVDSLLDLASYSLLALLLYQEEQADA